MHIKKFDGKDLSEALARIRSELGPEAVILETVQQRRPGRGVTVLAALPRDSRTESMVEGGMAVGAAAVASSRAERAPLMEFPSVSRRALAFDDAPPARAGRRPLPPRLETAGSAGPLLPGTNPGGNPLAPARVVPFPTVGSERASALEETRQLRLRVEHLNRLVRSDHFSAVPLPLRQLYFDLTEAEVDADLVFRILERMGSAPIPGQFTPEPPGELLAYLTSLVRTGGTVEPGERRILALVGPTGVGKTTTLAKIAGDACFHHGRSVALVSSDSYRVFGAQHLAAYSALMGLPFHAISSGAELRTLLDGRLSGADLVLIDTSGRSPSDAGGIAEVQQLLAACPDLDIHLALSASTRARDLARALDAFSVLPLRHLVFTKLDEATSRGGMFTTALKARCPVSWLGTGQEVPDDLEVATPAALTRGLLEEGPHGGSGR